MAARAPGKFAVLALVLLLVGFGIAFSRSKPARVWLLGRRLLSLERRVRDKARAELLETGRPSIDKVYARLVATYVADRFDDLPRAKRVAFVGRPDVELSAQVLYDDLIGLAPCEDLVSGKPGDLEVFYLGMHDKLDDVAVAFADSERKAERVIAVGITSHVKHMHKVVIAIPLPRDEALANDVVEEVKAALGRER